MREFACAVRSCGHWWSWYGLRRARPLHSRHPPADQPCETRPPSGRARRCHGVATTEASSAHTQSPSPSRSEPDHTRARGARTDHRVREPMPDFETGRIGQAGNAVQFPQGVGGTEMPLAGLFPLVALPQARPERTRRRAHRASSQ